MSLPLPGERNVSIAEAALAFVAVTILCALGGCSAPVWTKSMRAPVFKPARLEPRATRAVGFAQAARDRGQPMDAAQLLEGALGAAGLRVGTDGRVDTLWLYLSARHETVPVKSVRPGDVVLFDTRPGSRRRCADHAGIVERVDPDGRIVFIDARGGRVRTSTMHPFFARARRDARGEVLNSFLRTKRVEDSLDTPYLAGDMLCAVVRLTTPKD